MVSQRVVTYSYCWAVTALIECNRQTVSLVKRPPFSGLFTKRMWLSVFCVCEIHIFLSLHKNVTSLSCEQKPLLDCGQRVSLQDLAEYLQHLTGAAASWEHYLKSHLYLNQSYTRISRVGWWPSRRGVKRVFQMWKNILLKAPNDTFLKVEGPNIWRRDVFLLFCFFFYHELLVVERLWLHQAFGIGPAVARLGRGRNDPPSLGWILSLSADEFLLRILLILEHKPVMFVTVF